MNFCCFTFKVKKAVTCLESIGHAVLHLKSTLLMFALIGCAMKLFIHHFDTSLLYEMLIVLYPRALDGDMPWLRTLQAYRSLLWCPPTLVFQNFTFTMMIQMKVTWNSTSISVQRNSKYLETIALLKCWSKMCIALLESFFPVVCYGFMEKPELGMVWNRFLYYFISNTM